MVALNGSGKHGAQETKQAQGPALRLRETESGGLLSGGAGAGWDEATGRFTDAGKCHRTDDGSLGHAAATRGLESASGTFKTPSINRSAFRPAASCRFRQQEQEYEQDYE